MSVRDERRAPFAWVSLEALELIGRRLPPTRQAGARNAVLALAQAASKRRDGRHEHGDKLADLASCAGVGARRLREYLRDLEAIGLVEIVEHRDHAGRDLPTTYVLRDGGAKSSDRGAKSSDRGDGSRDELSADPSAPTRAREGDEEERTEEGSSLRSDPVAASGDQARDVDRVWTAYDEIRREVLGERSAAKLTTQRRQLIARRLREWPVEDLEAAVRGWRHSPHNRGENERGQPYCDLELVLRDAAHIERFRDLERNGPTPLRDSGGQRWKQFLHEGRASGQQQQWRRLLEPAAEACGRPSDVAAAAWARAVPALRERTGDRFDVWLAAVHPHRLDGDTLVLGAPAIHLSQLRERYASAIAETVGQPVTIVACAAAAEAA